MIEHNQPQAISFFATNSLLLQAGQGSTLDDSNGADLTQRCRGGWLASCYRDL